MCSRVLPFPLVVIPILVLLFGAIVQSARLPHGKDVQRPPSAKYRNSQKSSYRLPDSFDRWTEESGTNLWEHSGHLEGDIMTYPDEDRNGILNKTLRWPDAIVPFYIDEADFSADEVKVIMGALAEYQVKTCIKFRSFTDHDKNWIHIKGDKSGCWSSVGMHRAGQVVNLHTPKCVKHGIVIHELMHALGFFHQQSATDRDDYVKIHWEHISEGHEHNFNKYNDTIITSYGIGYDYGSVMHYGAKAFSKNGNITIESLQPNVELGQRKGLSEKDIAKVNKMYRKSCNKNGSESSEESYEDFYRDLINLFG